MDEELKAMDNKLSKVATDIAVIKTELSLHTQQDAERFDSINSKLDGISTDMTTIKGHIAETRGAVITKDKIWGALIAVCGVLVGLLGFLV